MLSKITPAGERTVIYDWAQSPEKYQCPFGVAILVGPRVGDLKVTVKDSAGAPMKSVAVSSTAQPSGQTALTGMSSDDGSVIFSGVLLGNYTLQAQKSGYASSSGKVNVTAGGANELTLALQAQPSSGIPGFPIESVVVGVLLCATWYWSFSREPRLRGV